MRWTAVLWCVGVFALAGCRSYEIERPTTPAGTACMVPCDAQALRCSTDARLEAESSHAMCLAGQERLQDRCSGYASDSERRRCESANGGAACLRPSPDTSACTQRWERCALACGGRMIER